MAARFWVGGSGTWNNSSTTNWSATSGGAGGASAPTTADSATFDANSGTAATVSVAATATCSACTANKADINLSLTGSPTFTGLLTLTTGTITLNSFTLSCGTFSSSNSNARTIAFGTGNITATGTGTVWTTDITTGLTVTGNPVVNVTNSGSVARSVVMGSTTPPTEANSISFNVTAGTDSLGLWGKGFRNLNFTGFSGTWNATGAAAGRTLYGSLTISPTMTQGGTSILTFAATSGTKTITTNGVTLDLPLTFDGVGGTFEFTDALTLGATRAFVITNGTVRLKAGTTNSVPSFTTGAGTTQRFLQSTVAGSKATITDASGTNATTYLTIQDIAAAGGATWNAFAANNNVDAGNNSGWNFGLTPQYAYEYPIELRSFTERKRF